MRGNIQFTFLAGVILPALLLLSGCGGGGSGCPPCEYRQAPSNDPGDVFRQCGPVDIVIVMDTSGSMDDEAEALCTQVNQVISELTGFGLTDLRLLRWGITRDADDFTDEFTCLTDNVRDLFNDPEVPGIPGRFLDDSESDEDWAAAVAIVSQLGSAGRNSNFQWRSGAVRIMIPISDEGPDLGDPPDTPQDAASIVNAANFANANNVIVAPIIADEAEVETAEHGRDLAEMTGGTASRSTDPSIDMGELIYNIVFEACGGQIDPPVQPGSPGATMLIAAGRNDGVIYALNTSTGAASRLVTTNVFGGGTGDVLEYVSSMIYNEETSRLWAGTGGRGTYFATTFSISSTGVATELTDNYDFTGSWVYAHPGMAMNRATHTIFGTAGDDDLVLAIDNISGEAFIHSAGDGETDETGNALTFVGDRLFLAAGEELWELDTFTGRTTRIADISPSGFPSGETDDFRVISMTTRPSDNTVFAILRGEDSGGNKMFLCTINVSNGTATNIGPTGVNLDGITWVPSGYFAGT